MSYIKYKTRGIIIGGSNVGEASRSYNIFTRDFGLIRVRAQGIRGIKSKLRYHLQNLFLTDLSLVRGKASWRVTEAYKNKSFSQLFGNDKTKLQSSTRILLFLKRMLPEEERSALLFDIINEGLDFMESEDLKDEEVSDLETLIVLRSLRSLGYIKANHRLTDLLAKNDYNKKLLTGIRDVKSFVIREINQSISASEL